MLPNCSGPKVAGTWGTGSGHKRGGQRQMNLEKERLDGPKHRMPGSAAWRAGPQIGITADCDMVAVTVLKNCLSSRGE